MYRRQVLVLDDVGEHAIDVGLVDRRRSSAHSSGASNETSSSSRSITVCSRRAPMFSVMSLTRAAKSAMRATAPGVNAQRHLLGAQQRRVLLDQRVARLGEDPDEVVARERLQLDADREATLQLRESDPTASRHETRRPR